MVLRVGIALLQGAYNAFKYIKIHGDIEVGQVKTVQFQQERGGKISEILLIRSLEPVLPVFLSDSHSFLAKDILNSGQQSPER
ncbi:hypothetical protein SDC9_204216 [bioreactor metagenome]|uniref:Uncharacterized protein n=1 Tax=bioreactor metagenome TaxID=1076179 RepID=A0A645IZ97_9ZZZZ